jgi:hypothetical protein
MKRGQSHKNLLDTYLSIWILKHPKDNRIFIFKKEVFQKFAFMERNRQFYEKAVILEAVHFLPLL